ncbi:MAG: SDR family NAD(P)-dependent oxidoreductase [Prolixibacteraceae bacterium]|nr:SDR family NAD(P)-dependent oxidoreductase [Prolixibacteraceae bacterium]
MSNIAFITGATSGIGKETAKTLALHGYRVIINGRRENLLNELSEEIITLTKTKPYKLVFDVRDREAVYSAINSLPDEWKDISLLINNAGLAAGFEPLHEGSFEDWDQMIDTNIKGILNVTKAVVNSMLEKRSGHIINVSSIAGKEAYPNGNVYCASKAAVESLTRAMRLDFLKYNIKVGSIAPGMVNTEFSTIRFHGDKERADNVYRGIDPLLAEDIAEAILFMATRPPHMNIDDMLITASAQGFSREVFRKL